jgi:hypothetical protein
MVIVSFILMFVFLHPVSPLSPWYIWKDRGGEDEGQRYATPFYYGCDERKVKVTDADNLTTFQCMQRCHRNNSTFATIEEGQHCECTQDEKAVRESTKEACEANQPTSHYKLGRSNMTVVHGSYTYTIVPKLLPWKDARKYCKKMHGGDLASVGMKDLKTRAKILNGLIWDSKHVIVWMGASFTAKEDKWIWTNGDKANDDTAHWFDGEPNSFQGKNEDCASITDQPFWSPGSDSGWRAYDAPCEWEIQGICEFKTPEN